MPAHVVFPCMLELDGAADASYTLLGLDVSFTEDSCANAIATVDYQQWSSIFYYEEDPLDNTKILVTIPDIDALKDAFLTALANTGVVTATSGTTRSGTLGAPLTLKETIDGVVEQRLKLAFNNAPELEGPEIDFRSTYEDASLVDMIANFMTSPEGQFAMQTFIQQMVGDATLRTGLYNTGQGYVPFNPDDEVQFQVRVHFGAVNIRVSTIEFRGLTEPTGFTVTANNPRTDPTSAHYFPPLPPESRLYLITLKMGTVLP